MAGNSQRKGSIRKSSKSPTAGSGGRVRRGLEGKGPTPKAKDRPYHKAYKSGQGSGSGGLRLGLVGEALGAAAAGRPAAAARRAARRSGSPGATRWSRRCARACR